MKLSFSYRVAQLARKHGFKFNEEQQPEVIAMRQEIADLEDSSINFQVSQYPDGSWSAVSVNVEGIVTGGLEAKEAEAIIKDAILTYYGIPSKYADDRLLRATGKAVTTEREVLVTA